VQHAGRRRLSIRRSVDCTWRERLVLDGEKWLDDDEKASDHKRVLATRNHV
jgi:hypothetical protein